MSETRVAVLPERIQNLVQVIEGRTEVTSRDAVALLQESGITASDLAAWTDYSHPDADSYGRQMVYDGGHYELMVMSWVDGDMSGIHDHGYTQWGAVKIYGAAEHATFEVVDGVMTTTSRTVCRPDSVLAVDHDLIHQMGNVGQENYLTLHLYGSPGRDGDVTADARLYDLEEGRVDITGGGAFFAPPTEAVDREESGPRGDFPTWLRFVCEWMQRSLRGNRSLDTGSLTDREARLAAKLFDATQWSRLDAELASLDQQSPKLGERYRRILARELLSCARLQQRLLAAGAAGEAFQPHATRLTELLENADSEGSQTFADDYLALLRQALA